MVITVINNLIYLMGLLYYLVNNKGLIIGSYYQSLLLLGF